MSQGGGGGMYQPNPYGQRQWGGQSFGGGNPWMRQQPQPFQVGNKMGQVSQEPGADPSQFATAITPVGSVRQYATPSPWIAPPGGPSGPSMTQPKPYGQPAMSDSFTDSGFSSQNPVNMAQQGANQFNELLAKQRSEMAGFGGGAGQMGGGSQPFMPGASQKGAQGPQTPSWYNPSMGPAEQYNLEKFPWLAHINGPNSAPPPQGWNAYAPGSEGYRAVFNPNRGQQLYPNQPWMWPFAGASNSPLR